MARGEKRRGGHRRGHIIYPPSSKGGSRAATWRRKNAAKNLVDKISSSSPCFLPTQKRGTWLGYSPLYLARLFELSTGILLMTVGQRQGWFGQGLWADINSKLINGRRDTQYMYIYEITRAAASLAIHPRFIVHRRRKSNSGQLN